MLAAALFKCLWWPLSFAQMLRCKHSGSILFAGWADHSAPDTSEAAFWCCGISSCGAWRHVCLLKPRDNGPPEIELCTHTVHLPSPHP